ncbi:hypothetical protein N7478_010025 [Penicillium angulare]|uniref:uncharacterized protein n=1 Tax=Penicillium angulare TaxID=116970 RepID=UPI0025420D8F|nr:uncharacterized protein N7478_010025 [Penicillium angulare]KAJ5267217.1 hypothetical protein N7478_010025 [Penicillium angulare]
MSTFWNPVSVFEIGEDLAHQATCCGITEQGARCKNRISAKMLKQGEEKLRSLARAPFHAQTLQPILHNIAIHFLCSRWHRDRQADQVSRHWYDAAVRNQLGSNVVLEHATTLSHEESDLRQPATHQLDRGVSYDTSETERELPQAIQPYVSPAMLRANNVPWVVSPAQPAIASVANISAGTQDLELHRLAVSHNVNGIHCTFCLAEDGDTTDENVILRCQQCHALSHLSCMELWLGQRDTGFDTSCCVCRSNGALDALIRPIRRRTASASALMVDRNIGTGHNLQLEDTLPTEDSTTSQGRITRSPRAPARREQPRRSARLTRDARSIAPPRRSTRLETGRMIRS